MLPLEKNRVRLDDDSDEDGIKAEGQEGAVLMMGLVEAARNLPQPVFEEKKPTLSQEELDAKQGTSEFFTWDFTGAIPSSGPLPIFFKRQAHQRFKSPLGERRS